MPNKEEEQTEYSKALEEDGYTGVAKYFKAFSMGINGQTDKFMQERKEKKQKSDELILKQKKERDEAVRAGANEMASTVDFAEKSIFSIRDNIEKIRTGDAPLDVKLRQINAEKDKMSAITKKSYDRINSTASGRNMTNDNQYNLSAESLNMLVNEVDFEKKDAVTVDGKQFVVNSDVAAKHKELTGAGQNSILSVDDAGELVVKEIDETGSFTDKRNRINYENTSSYDSIKKEKDSSPTDFTRKYNDYVEKEKAKGLTPMSMGEYDIYLAQSKQSTKPAAASEAGKNIMLWDKENETLKTSDPAKYELERKKFVNNVFDTITIGKAGVKDKEEMRAYKSRVNMVIDKYSDLSINPTSVDKKQLNALRMIETENNKIGSVMTQEVKDDLKRLRGNKTVIDSIDLVLDNPETAKVTTDVASKAVDFTNKVAGIKSEQTVRNVDFNTKAGKILFTFINSLSGSAYTASEIEAYKGILLGGDLTDETYVIGAINSFRETSVEENNKISERLFVTHPYSATEYRQYEKSKLKSKSNSTLNNKTQTKVEELQKKLDAMKAGKGS